MALKLKLKKVDPSTNDSGFPYPRFPFISIDPGLHFTGVALWTDSNLKPPKAWLLKQPSHNASSNFMYRARFMAKAVSIIAYDNKVEDAFIEFPIFYGSSAGGHMVAASGDLLKLCAVAGAIGTGLSCPVYPVKVPEWKGQLPKDVVIQRIKKEFKGPLGFEKDEWDAVGIGLWALGRF